MVSGTDKQRTHKNRSNYVAALKFLRRNLFPCLQEVMSSFRLFSVDKLGLQIIKYFSHRHKLHRLEAELYGVACFNIFQDILKSVLVSFYCQMCLLSEFCVESLAWIDKRSFVVCKSSFKGVFS